MGMFHRVADILSANLNDLVDRFEDPEKMLKQAIREMESAMDESLDHAAKVLATAKLTRRQLNDELSRVVELDAVAETAVRANDEAQARQVLARRQEHQTLVEALQSEFDAAEACGQRLRRQINGMRIKMSDARRRLATLSARRRTTDATKVMIGRCPTGVTAGESNHAIERAENSVAFAEAEAESLQELLELWSEEPAREQRSQEYVEIELGRIRQRIAAEPKSA